MKRKGFSSRELDTLRIARVLKVAEVQGGPLTIEEVAAIMNLSPATISKRVQKYQKEHQEVLPLKGYLLDMGSGTTHKEIIIALY